MDGVVFLPEYVSLVEPVVHSAVQRHGVCKCSGLVFISGVKSPGSPHHAGGRGRSALNTVTLDSEGSQQPPQG